MGSYGLKRFALGMNDEINTLGKLGLGTAFSADPALGTQFPSAQPPAQPAAPQQGPIPTAGTQPAVAPPAQEAMPPQQPAMAPQPEAVVPPPEQPSTPWAYEPGSIQDKWVQGMIARGIDPVFAEGMVPNIGDESGWNTSVQEHSPRSGKGGRGAYQLTGPRREEFERRYGPDGYTDENQMDFLAWEVLEGPESGNYQTILQEAGGDPRLAAAGIVNRFLRPAKEHAASRTAKYLSGAGGVTMSSRGGGDSELGVDTSELEELAGDELDPAKQRRQFQGSLLMGLGQGLQAMSKGESTDGFAKVMDSYYQRQSEARERMSEIIMERRRQGERLESRDWEKDDQAEAERRAIAAEDRGEARDIASEGRQMDRLEAERQRLATAAKGAINLMYGDSDFGETAANVADIDPTTALTYAEREQEKVETAAEEARLRETRQPLADMLMAQGHQDLAEQALSDPNAAMTNYEKRTGLTDITKEALILMDPTDPAAQALSTRLKLEEYSGDPRLMASATSQDKLIFEAEQRVNDARALDRQLQFAQELATSTPQGFAERVMLLPNQVLESLGLDREGLSQAELYDAMMKRSVAGVLAAENKGAASDRDTTFFQQSLPALGNTMEGNVTIAFSNRELLRREKVYVDAWRDFYNTAPGEDWANTNKRDAYIQERLQAENATGDIIPRVASLEGARSIPRGTPFIVVGDDGSQELVVLE